jgi:hypothetical protein
MMKYLSLLLFFVYVLCVESSGRSAPKKGRLPGITDKKADKRVEQERKKEFLLNQFNLSFEYGYGQLINDDAAALSRFYYDLNARLRIASNFLLSALAYTRGNIGIGLFYSRYISRASLNAFALSIHQKTFSGPYAEKLSINYFGPVLGIKSSVWDKKLMFVADLRPGLVLFFNDIHFADVIRNFSSPVFGLAGSMGLEYLMKSNFGISLSLNGLYASIPKATDANGQSTRTERSISRVDINLGIRFHINRKSNEKTGAALSG